MAVKDAGGAEDDDKVLYLAKCVQKSSVVVHAVCGHIRSPLTMDIVFGKETALELVVLTEDGSSQSVCEQPVFGTIKDMKVLPWNEDHRAPELETYRKDLLVLLSDSGKLSFLTFSIDLHRFLAVRHIHLSQPGFSLRELGWLLAAECSGRAVAVAAFEDQVAVFPTSVSAGSALVDKAIMYPSEPAASTRAQETALGTSGWGTVWSMTFLSSTSECKQGPSLVLAVLLHRRGAVSNELHLLQFDCKERSVQLTAIYNPSGGLAGDRLTFHVLEVPAFPGYLLLLRVGDIMIFDVQSTSSPYVAEMVPSAFLELLDSSDSADHLMLKEEASVSTDIPMVSSWCWESDTSNEPRLAFSVNSGNVFIAKFLASTTGKPSLMLCGSHHKCSPCKALLWLQGGLILALVEMGDGQVLKLEQGALTCQCSIQNIGPITDFALVDYYGEKQEQMFACCGAGQEGSIRILRNGNSVERLISTAPAYNGVSAIWTIRMSFNDPYHSFFVISFVEQTRVLSVGLNFVDITDAIGFDFMSNTLACGLIADHWLAQVCSYGVKLCSPTKAAHPSGVDHRAPVCSNWRSQGLYINLAAVCRSRVILGLSRPGLLIMLGTRQTLSGNLELVELQHCLLEAEISCISIPEDDDLSCVPLPPTIAGLHAENTFPAGVEGGKICVVGTHKPSVELVSIVPGENFMSLAVGAVSLMSSFGTAMGGCIPQDVRLALFDRLYILTGLRNGMLLRFEWPQDRQPQHDLLPPGSTRERPVQLHLIAVRRLGVSPVFLVPLEGSLRADIIALSDRPWLLQIARHNQRISYTSISFQPSTHATPVCSQDCPKGVLFIANCSLHLVEMEQTRTLNVQKLCLGTTPRRVLYHGESKLLLLLHSDSAKGVSMLSCLDPFDGAVCARHTFGAGEVARCMQLMKNGSEQLVLVGTSLSTGKLCLPSGEFESSSAARGHVLVLLLEHKNKQAEKQADKEQEWELTSRNMLNLPGAVLAVASYLGHYVLATAGNTLFCLGFVNEGGRLKRLASTKTRFLITTVTVYLTTIAVGDCRDGVLLYTYREETKKFELLECDPMQRLVADCLMVDSSTAAVTDRHGNFCALSSSLSDEDCGCPERNLTVSCWFHMGEVSTRIRKGAFAYKACPVEENCTGDIFQNVTSSLPVVASTLLGSVFVFIHVTREEYNVLKAVQERLARYAITEPVLGNNHARFRGQGCPVEARKALDGDMLAQFLELTSSQQLEVLKELPVNWDDCSSSQLTINAPVEQVLRMLERVHHALT